MKGTELALCAFLYKVRSDLSTDLLDVRVSSLTKNFHIGIIYSRLEPGSLSGGITGRAVEASGPPITS